MIINLPSDIGNLIRDTRKRNGLTQQQLGLQVGIQQRTISVIESDPSNTSLEKVVRICKALGLMITVGDSQANQKDDGAEW